MEFNLMSKDTIFEDIETLSAVFDFKFEVTDDFYEGAAGEFNKHSFLGIERDFIRVKPHITKNYEKFMAIFFHEFGHLLDINLHGDGFTPIQEMVASYVSVYLSSIFNRGLSVEAAGVLVGTIGEHGFIKDLDDVYKCQAYQCIRAFYNVMTENTNISYKEFNDTLELYRDFITEAVVNHDGDLHEAYRCLVE